MATPLLKMAMLYWNIFYDFSNLLSVWEEEMNNLSTVMTQTAERSSYSPLTKKPTTPVTNIVVEGTLIVEDRSRFHTTQAIVVGLMIFICIILLLFFYHTFKQDKQFCQCIHDKSDEELDQPSDDFTQISLHDVSSLERVRDDEVTGIFPKPIHEGQHSNEYMEDTPTDMQCQLGSGETDPASKSTDSTEDVSKMSNKKQQLDKVAEQLYKECLAPTSTVTKEIGIQGGVIEVGGCSITFPPKTFKEFCKVTAEAKIDPNTWPAGREVITPSLEIDAQGMTKNAKVRLTTWCIPDDDDANVEVEVMHLSENNEWAVIHECELGDSGVIEFKCRQFRPIIGTLRRIFLFSSPYRPVVCYAKHKFTVALYLDTELAAEEFFKYEKESLGKDTKIKLCPVIPCKKGHNVECNVSFQPDKFNFDPCGPFQFTVDRSLREGHAKFNQCVLSGEETEMNVKVLVNLKKQGLEVGEPQVFSYRWKPEYKTGHVAAAEGSHSKSSQRPINVNVKVDVHAENQSSIVGGIVNTGSMQASYTDYENKVTVAKSSS